MSTVNNTEKTSKKENGAFYYHYIDEAKVKKEENERLRIELEAGERKANRKAVGSITKGLCWFIVFVAIVAMLWEIKNRPGENECRVPSSANNYIGLQYETAKDKLYSAGFRNIKLKPEGDLLFNAAAGVDTVSGVSINGDPNFQRRDVFNKDAEVIINYHTVGNQTTAPATSEEFKGENYESVVKKLKAAGFNNIEIHKIENSVLNLLVKEGSVEEVSINGKTTYGIDTVFNRSDKVIVSYHTKKTTNEKQTSPQLGPDTITVPDSAKTYQGQNYVDVSKKLEDAGFTNIVTEPLDDLKKDGDNKEGKVDQITIGGVTDFKNGDRFDKSTIVRIRYHHYAAPEAMPGQILVPKSSKDYCGEDVRNVELMIRGAGFTDITLIPLNDLKKEGDKKESTVSEIGIQGETSFKKGTSFADTAVVIIKYHSYQPQTQETTEDPKGFFQKAGDWIGGILKKD